MKTSEVLKWYKDQSETGLTDAQIENLFDETIKSINP